MGTILREQLEAGNTAANNKVDANDGESRLKAKRRSTRVVIDIPVSIFGTDSNGKIFSEQTRTVTVSAHGTLLHVKSSIDSSRPVLIVNPRTEMEVQCRVAYRRDLADGYEVGLEFAKTLPKFWGIHFPPDDWDPSERKRPSSIQIPIPTKNRGSKP